MTASLRGQFLLAGRDLRDRNFYQSVVLIVEHGPGGAMGVIVNHPSGISLSQALSKHFEVPESGEMVYVGGPVEQNSLFILHNALDLDPTEGPVIDGLSIGSSPEVFEEIVRRLVDGDPDIRFRVYFGCAGWGPEQLEGELARNDWRILPGSNEFVFHPDPYRVWDLLMAQWNDQNPPLPGISGDHRMN
jgi:putative transcriptional regulator